MKVHLEEAVYDIDDTNGQRLVLTLTMPTNRAEWLLDLRPVQSLIGRMVDVQIAQIDTNGKPIGRYLNENHPE